MARRFRRNCHPVSLAMGHKKTSQSLKSKRKQGGWARFFRYWFIRLVRLQGHPQEIARGLAVGVFAGLFPWFGFQIIIALALAILFRGNKIVAAAATWISNPFTSVFIFAFNYKVGELLLGLGNDNVVPSNFQQDVHFWSHFMEMGSTFIITIFVGSFFMGMIASLITYFLSFRLIKRWHDIRHLQKKK